MTNLKDNKNQLEKKNTVHKKNTKEVLVNPNYFNNIQVPPPPVFYSFEEEIVMITNGVIFSSSLRDRVFIRYMQLTATVFPQKYLPKKRYNLLQVLNYSMNHCYRFDSRLVECKSYEKWNKKIALSISRLFLVDEFYLILKELATSSIVILSPSNKINLLNKHHALLDDLSSQKDISLDAFFEDSKQFPLEKTLGHLIGKMRLSHASYKILILFLRDILIANSPKDSLDFLNDFLRRIFRDDKEFTTDIVFFSYLYKEYRYSSFNNISSKFTDVQLKQLKGYFDEINILIELITLITLAVRCDALTSLVNLEFLTKKITMNTSVEAFTKTPTCSNNVYSDTIKMLDLITAQLYGYYFNLHSKPTLQDTITFFVKGNMEETLNKREDLLMNQVPFTQHPVVVIPPSPSLESSVIVPLSEIGSSANSKE